MNSIVLSECHASKRNERNLTARRAIESRRFERLLLADWKSFVFLHFETDPDLLQSEIPFELDLFEGRCFVSLVAFRMENMRFQRGGAATHWLTALIADHHFLNVRTYVKHRGESGIFFIREWLDNRAAVALGPWVFGLPYRLGEIVYDHLRLEKKGRVADPEGSFEYAGETVPDVDSHECGDPLENFLLERYTAFCAEWHPRFFRVWHKPWRIQKISTVEISDESLFERAFPTWWHSTRFVSGHYSEGVENVWMGRPHLA